LKGKIIAKVCDFGLGKDQKSLSYYTRSSASGYGQILYVSPEQREKLNSATIKSDIYSLGKLVYFIFTGKDPDNQKPFELSSLVLKATEENPESRFANITEFKRHFKSLKDLMLNQKIPDEYVTLKDIVKSEEEYSWLQFHNLVKEGKYLDHVYDDFLEPVMNILEDKKHLLEYYSTVGKSIREGVLKISERLFECYNQFRWPFSATKTFGKVLKLIATEIPDSQVRLICLEHLWHLAYVMDQWDVQSQVKLVFNSKIITSDIETQLSEFIIKSEKEIEITTVNSIRDLPHLVKTAIIKADKIAKEKEARRQAEMAERFANEKW
jgi:serine/threonine protein kinase